MSRRLSDFRVEMAFGAGGLDPLQWTWTDVTADIPSRTLDQGISIVRGRADESSETQPSSVTITFDNPDGAFTPDNPNSPYWPNVVRHTPIRISMEGAGMALLLDGQNAGKASTPHAADLAGGTELDIRARIMPDAWNGAFVQSIASKFEPGAPEYEFLLNGGGSLAMASSTNGTSFDTLIANQVHVAALCPIWVALTFEVDNGLGGRTATWYRYDGHGTPPADVTDWELVHTEVQTSGPTSIAATTSELLVGQGLGGFRGRIFAAEFRDSINGTVVANPDFSAQTAGATSFTDGAGKVWTIEGTAEISTRRTRFVGHIDDITPTWPNGDNHPGVPITDERQSESRVQITATGILRRLQQGEAPIRSSLFRHVTSDEYNTNVVAYWPGEDANAAVELGAGLETHGALSLVGEIEVGNNDSLPSSGPLATVAAGEQGVWLGSVPNAPEDRWAVDWVFRLSDPETSPASTQLMTIHSRGTSVNTWRVFLNDTNVIVEGLDEGGGQVFSDPFGVDPSFFNQWVLARLEAFDDGTDITWSWSFLAIDDGTLFGGSGVLAGVNLGRVTRIGGETTGPTGGYSFGHIIVSYDLAIGWLSGADTAWVGESAAHRFYRLCTEESVPAEVIGDPYVASSFRGDVSRSQAMGPQKQSTLLELLRECVDLDMGVMISRRGAPGLVYRTRATLYSQQPALEVDASANEITVPFVPVLDDYRLRNKWTVASASGSSASYTDEVSAAAEGMYDDSIETAGIGGVLVQRGILDVLPRLNIAVRTQNRQQAAWRVHLGTWPGMRYPTVAIDLLTAPQLSPAWQELELGDRVTVTGLPNQHPDETVELLVEHMDEQLSPTVWRPVLTCSPGGPWLVGTLDDGTGTVPEAQHLSGTDVELASAVTDVATSLPLDTAEWSVDPNHFPVLIKVGGELISVAGATLSGTITLEPCTRSINNVTKAHAAGTAVELHRPKLLALGNTAELRVAGGAQSALPVPALLNPADVLLSIDAADPLTWGQNRTYGQWIIAGNRFQVGAAADDLNLGDGFGLTWDGAGTTVASFAMQNGETARIRPNTYLGKAVIHTSGQFVDDGSYSAANNQPDGSNPNVNVPPSDAPWHDGTPRIQLALLETAMLMKGGDQGGGVTRDADVIRAAVSFRRYEWMDGDDFTTSVLELHEPTGTKTSPITGQLRLGEFRVFSRDSATALAPTDPNPPTFTEMVNYTLPAVGQWVNLIFDFRLDPVVGGNTGYFDLWSVDSSTGERTLEASFLSNWGYIFDQTDPDLNDEWYLQIMNTYQFHEFSPDPPSTTVNNWDPVGGNVRDHMFPYFEIVRGTGVSIDQLHGRILKHLDF